MVDGLGGVLTTSKMKGMALFQKMMQTPAGLPIGVLQGPDLFNRALDDIYYETVGALINLPYLEALQGLRRGMNRKMALAVSPFGRAERPSP